MLGSAERRKVKLISREIIFRIIPKCVITVHQRYRRMDRQTDNLSWQYRAPLCFARQKFSTSVALCMVLYKCDNNNYYQQ